jgi:hypothetical protein
VTRDPARRLLRALDHAARAAQVEIAWEPLGETAWSSALFTGTRHRLSAVAPAGGGLDAFLAALPEADLPVRGGYLTEVAVASLGETNGWRRMEVSALVLEA